MSRFEWFVIGIIVLIFGLVLAQPYFKARSINKFSNVKIGYFDALLGTIPVIISVEKQ